MYIVAELSQAEPAAAAAKKEFLTVLAEFRDPDFLKEYGVDILTEARDIAKQQWTVATE